jgi:hypothetical protein
VEQSCKNCGSQELVKAEIPYDSLDNGIREYVRTLASRGVETFESCEGGQGHAYPEPTIRFYGERDAGWHALAVAQSVNLGVSELRRVWPIVDGEPTGPWWELTFREPQAR